MKGVEWDFARHTQEKSCSNSGGKKGTLKPFSRSVYMCFNEVDIIEYATQHKSTLFIFISTGDDVHMCSHFEASFCDRFTSKSEIEGAIIIIEEISRRFSSMCNNIFLRICRERKIIDVFDKWEFLVECRSQKYSIIMFY